MFTNNQLGNTIAESFQNDIQINGIIEQINTQGSEYEYLLDLGVNVISHQGLAINSTTSIV